jgi:hypothetical protein
MNNQEVINRFQAVKVFKEQGKISLHKPVLLLYALAQCWHGKERLLHFYEIDKAFKDIFIRFSLSGEYKNSYYPFGKLENDGIWEVTNSKNLKRTSVGHLYKSELLEKNICGGFTENIYNTILNDKVLIKELMNYLLSTYFDSKIHKEILHFLGIENNNENKRNQKMALIGNQTFALSRWWASKTIEIVKVNRNIFAKENLRELRKELIAGSNVVSGIQGWMLAAQLIQKIRTGEYELTNFARSIYDNDSKLEKSASWWAIHLSICFSERREPYSQFFCSLDSQSKDWIKWKDLTEKIDSIIEEAATGSVEPNLQGVRGMFEQDRPLADLGLIEIRKNRDEGVSIRLGNPKLTDEIIIHALATTRFNNFKSRSGINFSELEKINLHQYLCCSRDTLRQHLRRMNQSHRWQNYFSFNEAANLESISFNDDCDPRKTLLLLLQQGEDTWL